MNVGERRKPLRYVEGSVVDDSGMGVSFAYVQLFRYAIVDGLRRIQTASSVQADEIGEFRVFGLSAEGYFVGRDWAEIHSDFFRLCSDDLAMILLDE
jgi:hypothetical protein